MIYNKFLENIVLVIGDKLYGTKFINTLNEYRKLNNIPLNKLKEIQSLKLKKLLEYSINNIPYYKKLNIRLTDNPYSDIYKFPIIDKKLLRENHGEFTNPNYKKLVTGKSSGSTGTQSVFYRSKKEISIYQGIQTYLWEWSGYRIGENLIQLGITPNRGLIKSIKDFLFKTHYLPAFNINEDFILNFFKNLNKKKVYNFGGYASGLYLYADTLKRNNLKDVKIKSVISWGDKVFDLYRKVISEMFEVKIFDTYGSSEGFVISGQCEKGNYHLMIPHIFLEIQDDKSNEVNDGEIGKVIVTNLDAYSMPFIRFDLGDLAIKKNSNEVCECGRNFPMLEKIVGRETDIVVTPSGKKMIVHSFTGIFEHFDEISQFRVIQNSSDFIIIEYIKSSKFSLDALKKIEQKIHHYLQEEFRIEFKEVDNIPPTKSGKPQIIENTFIK
ncbi:MAG TPA: hypothetical protein DIS94_02630 [Bacteroidetes bacterium]|nr:hypothetical protein [Bacteroidota bacterium]